MDAEEPVTQRQIRERVAARPATVTNILEKLVRDNRVEHNTAGGYRLAGEEGCTSQVISEGHYKGWTLRDAMADFDRKAAEWKEVGEPRLRALIKQVEEETKDIDKYLARAREENNLGNDELTLTLVRLFEEGYTEEEAAKHPTVLRLINEKFGLTD